MITGIWKTISINQKNPGKLQSLPGHLEPIFHTGYNWIKVAIPATNMAFCKRIAICAWLIDGCADAAIRVIGIRFDTNMARMCWSPKGMALAIGTVPFSKKSCTEMFFHTKKSWHAGFFRNFISKPQTPLPHKPEWKPDNTANWLWKHKHFPLRFLKMSAYWK